MEHKALKLVLAEDRPGRVQAVFSTFNVIDKDGDVTLPGAFEDGAPVRISAYGHRSWMGELPVGKGIIRAESEQAVLDGEFFLNTTHGRDTYETVKAMGDMQEWSYGFDVIEAEEGEFNGQRVRFLKRVKVHEVSPVLLGAGVNTRTLAIKAVKGAIRPHTTDVVDRAWNGPNVEAAIPNDAGAAVLRQMFAWVDPEGDPDAKSSYRFIHHHWTNGEPGPANVRACITGIAILNGARGGTTIPDEDREGVYNHLAKHLRDAGIEPPELRSRWDADMKFDDHLLWVGTALEEVTRRARDRASVRAKEGRVLSAANRQRLQALLEALDAAAADIRELLEATAPPNEAGKQALLQEFARYQQLRARLHGVA